MSRGSFLSSAGPRVFAHRGLALEAPENTLLAFALALSVGAGFLETDVHGSADGQAVISHDEDLSRVAGRDVRVSQLTMAELRRIRLGEGQGFASLTETLDAFPEAKFNIDVKSWDAVGPTIAAVREARATDRVLIGSFNGKRRIATVDELPGVATSVSARGVAGVLAGGKLHSPALLRRVLRDVSAVQVPVLAAGLHLDTASMIERIHAAGAEVHFWTINDADEMTRLLDLGADGIVTDRADLAVPLLAARA